MWKMQKTAVLDDARGSRGLTVADMQELGHSFTGRSCRDGCKNCLIDGMEKPVPHPRVRFCRASLQWTRHDALDVEA